jgi:group I intron endonuclease
MDSGIYQIINTLTNDSYIGSSINLIKRKNQHFHKLRKNNHVNKHLQNSYNKYGEDFFYFNILSKCPIEYCVKLEQWFLNNLNPTFNKRKDATSNYGIKFTRSKEHNEKISKSLLGIKRDDSTKEKIKIANLNKKLSQETKDKISVKIKEISKGLKGIKRDKSIIEKIKRTKKEKGLTEKQILSRSVKVIDNSTGIIYESVKKVSENFNLNYGNLIRKLKGHRNNNTRFSYLNSENK